MNNMTAESHFEYVNLIYTKVRIAIYNLFDHARVACKYYSNLQFCKSDISLSLMYIFDNPFGISKLFRVQRGDENIYDYGETPLTTLDTIARESNITARDHVYELGCGRGRCCFWLNAFKGCAVTGVEQIPEFVDRAIRIKNKLCLKGITFQCGDFLQMDLSAATVIYLYGTTLSDTEIQRLVDEFKGLRSGTKIITVSYPLTDYDNSGQFEVMKSFTVPFPWGNADVYLQVKR